MDGVIQWTDVINKDKYIELYLVGIPMYSLRGSEYGI